MSKRAKGAALKAYSHFTSENVDEVTRARELFCKGYEQAEKDLGWHSVEESLPETDKEVIVLADELDTAPIYRIAVGHIVDKMHCLDYSGWNIPGVKYWMPMPKIKEEGLWLSSPFI